MAKVEVWEIEDCKAYWFLPSGDILGTDLPHSALGLQIAGRNGYFYLRDKLGWMRVRPPCPRRNYRAMIFEAVDPISQMQKKLVLECVELYPDLEDVFLRLPPTISLQGSQQIKTYLGA